jgi:hypothetical protein
MNTEKNSTEIREKKINATKEIIGGIIKFCVGAFFGATAAYITRESTGPKIERYSIIAGGAMAGLYVGGQYSDCVNLQIDSIAERMQRMQQVNEEAK